VRKLAFELGLDLAAVPASSSTGRISMEDVRTYAERVSAAPALRTQNILVHSPIQAQTAERREPLTGLRKRIAEHMERSWRTIPHATAFDELDASGLVELRRLLFPAAEKLGVRLTYMPLLMKLLIPPLKAFPIFNASLDEEKREIVYKDLYHLGVATASPEGLLVPVLHDVDRLSILQIARQLETLIAGAQKRTLAPNDLRGSTFTLNNVGSFGGSSGTPIINYPEAAILAVGKIEEKAIVCNGSIIVQARMPLALSFDHRLIDGALAGAFLARFKELAEHPQQLLLDLS
jgi:pyruvate dehydrogenase E2 component (dihydrolipoamide acetyltransferase)